MTRWTASDMPFQNGRTAVVTGTGGLGFESALALARRGGDVILAGRNPGKGADAISRIRSELPSAEIRFERLDLADLGSVAHFAERMGRQRDRIDLLINNAGVMVPPCRQETSDGFELQFGTNYLGHFALTARLLALLRRGRNPRVISVSSIAARRGMIDFNDLNAERSYETSAVYSQSKLACLMFAFELQRRSDALGWGVTSIAAHPGISRTDLIQNGPGRWSEQGIARSLLPFLFQPAPKGALPTLFAATAVHAAAGGYYGPTRWNETRGHPAGARIPPHSLDEAVSVRLWSESEELTGVRFEEDATAIRPDQPVSANRLRAVA